MGEVEHIQFQQVERELQNIALESAVLKKRKRLSKQMSMSEVPPREIAWERRRQQERRTKTRTRRNSFQNCDNVTDDDLHELKGCIELGFGFNEEDGQKLCNTLPALDLYFAVNRQLSPSPGSTPHRRSYSSFESPVTAPPPPPPPPLDSDSWKICSPGDDPEHVKTKLRHWAQAVACSVMQSH